MIARNSEQKIPNLLILIAAFGFGTTLGLLIGNIPFLKFKSEIDMSALISILALFVATVVVPFKINAFLSNRRSKNSILLTDLDELLDLLNSIEAFYEDIFHAGRMIKIKDQKKMLFSFKKANNKIDTMNERLKSMPQFADFNDSVALPFSREVYPAFTEKFIPKKKISEQDCIAASAKMEKVITALKEQRYKIYQ